MKENKNNMFRKQIRYTRSHTRSSMVRFIFSFRCFDVFQSSKVFGENLSIRFANLRV
jgi:hypothetical protein